ncbi:MAG: TolC family protein, partial [Novosphingobium sp.]
MRSIVLLAVAVLIQPIGSAWAQGAVAPPPPWEPAGSAGAIPADVPRPGATPIVRIPLAPAPVAGPFDARAGPPAVRPNLPVGTPDEQRHADPSAPITDLRAAIERAYWTNPELIAERARLRGADFRLPQARGEYGLQLQYSASYDYRRESFEQAVGQIATRTGWTGTAGAVLAQPLFTFGRLRAGEDAARGEIAFARASLENVEQQTLFDTIAAYAAVLRDRAGVGIAGDNVALLEREFGDTRERFGARESTVTDLQQVRSRLELARA